MATREEEGLILSLENEGVLHNALTRVGLPRSHPDYDDYLQDARLIYAQYYAHYGTPLDTPSEREKFNRLAGWFVFLRLIKRRGQLRAHRTRLADYQTEEFAALRTLAIAAIDVTDTPLIDQLAMSEAMTKLWRTASDPERTLLRLRAIGLSDREIAPLIALTPRSVGRMRKRLAQRYHDLVD
ncbi:hypothetical protein [Lacticaseibacillus absianus]|uniref:hypothetical protein n=1 Tax=Lacticaseibacillus absianus TaxID=2729623 RepID=UPI0015C7BEBB|nr:hypothetical protein [Lacticaseibacillus absianus]